MDGAWLIATMMAPPEPPEDTGYAAMPVKVIAVEMPTQEYKAPPKLQTVSAAKQFSQDLELLGKNLQEKEIAIVQEKKAAREQAVQQVQQKVEETKPDLKHPDPQIRKKAVKMMVEIAPHGDVNSITLLCKTLEDESGTVREEAVKSLAKICDKGDETAITGVCTRLEHSSNDVRATAMIALSIVTSPGDTRTLSTVRMLLGDGNAQVRGAAFRTLRELATKGDPPTIAKLVSMLEDTRFDVRNEAQATLCEVGIQGDEKMISQVTALLKHPHAEVRKIAVDVAAKMSLKGDDKIITAVCTAFNDENSTVRAQVVPSLLEVAGAGNKQAVSAFCIFLEHPNGEIRSEAITALKKLGGQSDNVANAVSKYMTHTSPEVRRSVVEAMQAISPKGSKVGITATVSAMQDEDAGVQERAARALVAIADTNDIFAIDQLNGVLGHWFSEVRVAAVKALGSIASKNSNEALKVLRAKMETETSSDVLAVMEAIQKQIIETPKPRVP